MLRLYNEGEWEEFVREWAEGFVPKYAHIDRLGGPGDKGRDVIGYAGADKSTSAIDIYQCKHYGHPLYPGDVWLELAKLCVFTHNASYRVPRAYRFLAPQGVGTALADLLANPVKLRTQLMALWADKCEHGISTSSAYPLTGALLQYVQNFDFAIVGYVSVPLILEQHARTPHWHKRFKRDFPKRPDPEAAPAEIHTSELRYVDQLLAAYADHLKLPVPDVKALDARLPLQRHFHRARTDFYLAEGLHRFYRDQFPGGAFEHVKKQIYDGVVEIASSAHADAFVRVQSTVQQAVTVPLAQSDHTPYVEPGDRKGICHHLANDDKLQWVVT